MKNDMYSFKEFIQLDEEKGGFLDWIRGIVRGADNVPTPGAGIIKPSRFVQSTGESFDDWMSRIREVLRKEIGWTPETLNQAGGPHIHGILFGWWQTIMEFMENPTQQNWEAVARIMNNSGYRPYSNNGQLGGWSMTRDLQRMGKEPENTVVDTFWNLMIEIMNQAEGANWDEWL